MHIVRVLLAAWDRLNFKISVAGSNFSCIFDAIVWFSRVVVIFCGVLFTFRCCLKIHLLIFLHSVSFSLSLSFQRDMTAVMLYGIRRIRIHFLHAFVKLFDFTREKRICYTKACSGEKSKTKAIANPSEAILRRYCSVARAQLETVKTIWTLNNVNNVHYSQLKLKKRFLYCVCICMRI